MFRATLLSAFGPFPGDPLVDLQDCCLTGLSLQRPEGYFIFLNAFDKIRARAAPSLQVVGKK